MAFRLLILYLVLTFLRLGELYPALAPYQIMSRGLLLCGAATAGAMALGRVQYLRLPQPYLVVAFMLWCMSSAVLAQRWLGGYAAPFAVLSPNVALFLLLFLNLDSERRLRIGVAVLAVLGLIVALQALYSYHTLWRAQTFLLRTTEDDMERDVSWDSPESAVSEAEVEADPQPPATEQGDDTEQAGDSRPASQVYIVRLRSLGFLHDPNDFAQALVSMVPLVLALRRPSRRLGNLLLVWLPIAGLLYAIALTRSRGAIIALATLCFLALRPWLGRAASLVIGTLGGVAAVTLGFTAGRSLSVDESAAGRLEAWAAGIDMLKSSPVWGVGQGLFTDHHGLVAHNSFVHCFAETGLVGYSLWLSMIALTLYGLHRVEVADPREGDDDLRRLAHAARLALTAFLVAAFFLSRTYGALLFLLLGLGTAVCAVAQRRGISTVPAPYRWIPAAGVFAITSVFGFWVLMKVLG